MRITPDCGPTERRSMVTPNTPGHYDVETCQGPSQPGTPQLLFSQHQTWGCTSACIRCLPLVLWESTNMIAALSFPGPRFDVDTHPTDRSDRSELAETRSNWLLFSPISVGVSRLFFIGVALGFVACRLLFFLANGPHRFNDQIRDLWLRLLYRTAPPVSLRGQSNSSECSLKRRWATSGYT